LAGLDGIRGLAALYVVVHHTLLRSFPGYPASTGPFWVEWLIYGHFAVVIFIVLSGFSLSVSPARHGWELGGVPRFAQRRAWRILPPYWAALIFSLLVAWLYVPQPGQPKPDTASVVVNGLLVQDVFDASTPNRAFWTIAVEAHLYVMLPLLLLLVRRVNAIAMVAAVTVTVVGIGLLAPVLPLANWLLRLTPQFAVLFAVGVLAAGIVAAGERRRAWPWSWLALATGAPVLAAIVWRGSVWTIDNRFWVAIALGPAIGCLLAAVAIGRPAPLVRVLDTRPLRRLGSFSYSLYLTHAPIVVIVNEAFIVGRVPQGVPSFLVSVAIVVPLTIAFAWLFAAVFEFPFQKYRSWSALRAALPRRSRTVPVSKPPQKVLDQQGGVEGVMGRSR
jgi:peptidoglycan/LPS O-acetylase OafA/YrhL